VPAETTRNLGALLVPCQYVLWSIMLMAIYRYRIDKSTHENNLRALGRK